METRIDGSPRGVPSATRGACVALCLAAALGPAAALPAQLAQPLEIVDGPARARIRTWPVAPSAVQGPFVDFTAEGAFGVATDVVHEVAWAYRLGGDAVNHLLHAGAGQLAEAVVAPAGWLGSLRWPDVDGRGFAARLDVAVEATEPSAGSARFSLALTVTNPGSQPLSLTVLGYADVDNFGATNDRIEFAAPDRFGLATVARAHPHSELWAGPAPSAWETDAWSGNLRNRILGGGGSPYNLVNSHRAGRTGLDVTAAFQWTDVVLAAGGGTATFRLVVGRNDLQCAVPHAASTFGAAVADGFGRVPILTTVRGPVAGAEQQLDVEYAPNAPGVLLFGDATSFATCGLELLVVGAEFPLQLPASGRLPLVFPASADPAFCGLVAHFQALFVAPVGGPCAALPVVHSAGLRWVFGD